MCNLHNLIKGPESVVSVRLTYTPTQTDAFREFVSSFEHTSVVIQVQYGPEIMTLYLLAIPESVKNL